MKYRTFLSAAVLGALAFAMTEPLGGQAPPTPAQQPPAPAQQPPAPPAGRRGDPQAVFPAQQRPPGDPAMIERGRGIFTISCSACHGRDLRGGTTGGPNLLRSGLVLSDKDGELILPIVRGARAERGMPALPLSDEDVRAVAEFIHSVAASMQEQGAPPDSAAPPPNPIVGDASAGETYFRSKCASCHSPTGDLQGIATRVPEGKALQNAWVSGSAGRGRRNMDPAAAERRAATATIKLASGETVEGTVLRVDNFLITLRQAVGTRRTFERNGAIPAITLKDPLAAHRTLPGELTDKDMHDVTAYLATLK